jgi:glutathione peroxidase-family protein
MKVLILGGYGTFGGRLAQLLAVDKRITLLIAGRSLPKAQAFCERLVPGASRGALRFDRDGDALAQIRAAAPNLVVDATGPFQCYGEDTYRIIKACLALGIDYLDLADGADFVAGVSQFDREARELGVLILSGVSSFPVLTAAVLRRLSQGMATLDTVVGGIAPSPYAGVGMNVIRAIASYSGKRIAMVRAGQPSVGIAMTESLRYTISPPGRLPLRNIRFSLVEVPDLQVLPKLWPGLKSLWMGAGLVPQILHRMLNGLAWLVRLRLLHSLLPFAPLIYQVSNRVRWGEHRGGMFVAITGTDEHGAAETRSWHLLAEGEDGPLIPSMACQALIERCLASRRPAVGARAATTDLELEDYETLFARRTIYSGTRTRNQESTTHTLYRRILGDAWDGLPARLRAMHQYTGRQVATGQADVVRGSNPLARLAAFLAGFPAAGRQVPVQVVFTPVDGGESWTRTFAGQSFTSFQSAGSGKSAHLLRERFGPLTFDLALVVEGSRLSLVVRGWSIYGLPLPRFLAPAGDLYESVIGDRFHFHVEICQRFLGLVVGYRGWLEIGPRGPGLAQSDRGLYPFNLPREHVAMSSLFEIDVKTIDGESRDLSDYRGKYILIVNVASKCGFTPQYAGLEKLYRNLRDRGVVVLGFPCDQFGHQEPGDEAEIKNFCSLKYEVSFPMFAKIDVNGTNTHPLYQLLKHDAKGLLGSEAIKWNFTKFLIGPGGEVIKRYAPTTAPAAIEKDVLEFVSKVN